MSYDPKWIRDDAVVKRDGTNDLTGDWDIGNQRKIILDEFNLRDDHSVNDRVQVGVGLDRLPRILTVQGDCYGFARYWL